MYSIEDTKSFLRDRVARPASAGIIIENERGEGLVLKAHYKNYWSFPGGWIEENQTPIEAAVRELEEEAGITVSQSSLKFAFILNRVSDALQTYQFIFKRNEPVSDAIIDSIILQPDEIAEYRFVSKDAVKMDLNNYGGAVQLWATNEEAGYFEQEVKL